MTGQLQTFDFIVLVAYMGSVFGLGCWFARKSGTTEEFMAAGRSLPGWAVGLSVFGTYVSSIGFLGNTGKAYGGTWNSWVFGLSLPIAAIFAVRYFIPLYRGSDEVSAYYHLERRFGPWARTYALVCYLLSQLARIGTIMYLVALALAPLTGWDIRTIIVVTGVLVTAYTLLGGIEAVIWTDVVQSVVLIAGAILCALLLVFGGKGGAGEIARVANEKGKFSLGNFSADPQLLLKSKTSAAWIRGGSETIQPGGKVRFRRTYQLPDSVEKGTLRFDATTKCDVFFNDQLVSPTQGWREFYEVELSAFEDGENSIRIELENDESFPQQVGVWLEGECEATSGSGDSVIMATDSSWEVTVGANVPDSEQAIEQTARNWEAASYVGEEDSKGDFVRKALSLPSDPTFWMVLIYGIFINLQNFGIDQSFVQRYVTAKTDRDAKFSIWLACFMFPVVSLLFFYIGTSLYSRAQMDPEFLDQVKQHVVVSRAGGADLSDDEIAAKSALLKSADIGDKVLPQFIISNLPTGLAGLLIAAIFAAAMSSMDTSLNSSATLVLCDVYRRYLKPNAGERESMVVLYGSTLLFGVAGTIAALAMIHVRSALDMWWNLQGIFTGGMLGLFLLGLISKRARNAHGFLAAALGVLVICWLSLSTTQLWPSSLSGYVNPLHSYMTIVVGTSSIVLVGVLAAAMLKPRSS